MSDMREYFKFYGIWLDDWDVTWGGTAYERYLIRDWIATAESEPSSTWVSTGRSFLYPHHLKKVYWLEGVVEGEVTFGSTVTSTVSNYRVSVYKQNTDTTTTDLASTGVITVANYRIPANNVLSYHFWIDAFNAKELSEYDRLGVKVEWNLNGKTATATAKLQHDYWASEYDLWVDVPLILGD
jgi:hypothetical protein